MKKKQKGMKLLPKMMCSVMIPLFVLVAFSGLAMRQVAVKLADALAKDQLETAVVGMENMLEAQCDGEYVLDGKALFKGETNLTEHPEVLDIYQEETGIDITVFVGDERMATSIVDQNNKRILFTKMSPEVYESVLAQKVYFAHNVIINGKTYYGYYEVVGKASGKELILFAGKSADEVHDLYAGILLSSNAFMLIIALVICFMVMNSIVVIIKMLLKLGDYIDLLKAGNLDVVVEQKYLDRRDELGHIARAIQKLAKKLNNMMWDINSGATRLHEYSKYLTSNFDEINQSIANINLAVEEIATGATNQAHETESLTEEMATMGNSVTDTTNSVKVLLENTDDMRHQNQSVAKTLEELIQISDHTAKSVESVHQQTTVTNKSAQDIRNAVDIISEIASQTNLLSLNASIEAARAGENGKGFAVVAEEVHKLADQSQEAVNEIDRIVKALIENSNASVEIMDTVIDSIKEQGGKLTDTKGVFDQLNADIVQVAEEITRISKDIVVMEEAKDQVLTNLENLAAISQENAAGTEETSATMNEVSRIIHGCNDEVGLMEQVAETLNADVSVFKLAQKSEEEE